MKFAAVLRSWIIGPSASASVAAIGAWTRLQSFAASDGQESALLMGAKGWTSRDWIARVNLLPSEVEAAISAGLAKWVDVDLFVEGFDEEGLGKIKLLRNNGKFGAKGGRPKGQRKPNGLPNGFHLGNPMGSKTKPPIPLPFPFPSDQKESAAKTPPPILHVRISEPPDPDQTPIAPAPHELPVMTFKTDGSIKTWNLFQSQVDTWQKSFPTLDVMAECRVAHAWTEANPSHRKKSSGMPRFLVSWFSRSKERMHKQSPLASVTDVRIGRFSPPRASESRIGEDGNGFLKVKGADE
jgi:hypothetical protein